MNYDSNLYTEINLDHLVHNVESLINTFKGYKYYMGMVSANAYGHGFGVLRSLVQAGINYFIVSSFEEAIEVRKIIKKTPILCLEPINQSKLNIALKERITVTIYQRHDLDAIAELKNTKGLKTHLFVALHKHQLGIFNEEEMRHIYNSLKELNVTIEGIYTKMDAKDEQTFNQELSVFMEITKLVNLEEIPIIHIYNSESLMKYPKLKIANGARLGIVIYGVNPTDEITSIDFRNALQINSRIIKLQTINQEELPEGSLKLVSSGFNVGIIPVGIVHGLSKKDIGRNVTVNFKRFKILGVESFHTLIAVDEDTKVLDKVTLYGGLISMKEASQYLDISVYELLYHLPPEIPRYYYENNKLIGKEGK